MLLLNLLQMEDMRREVKPDILAAVSACICARLVLVSCCAPLFIALHHPIFVQLGDLALAVGDTFVKYVQPVMNTLCSAMQLSLQALPKASEDELWAEYNNRLRSGILSAFANLINGLSPLLVQAHLTPQMDHVVLFLAAVASDKLRDDEVTKAATNLLGDVAKAFPGLGRVIAQHGSSFQKLLKECAEFGDEGEDAARYAMTWLQNATSRIDP